MNPVMQQTCQMHYTQTKHVEERGGWGSEKTFELYQEHDMGNAGITFIVGISRPGTSSMLK